MLMGRNGAISASWRWQRQPVSCATMSLGFSDRLVVLVVVSIPVAFPIHSIIHASRGADTLTLPSPSVGAAQLSADEELLSFEWCGFLSNAIRAEHFSEEKDFLSVETWDQ